MKKTPMPEMVLRASKEIVVKFIEVGRVSPTSFPEAFTSIYKTIADTVGQQQPDNQKE